MRKLSVTLTMLIVLGLLGFSIVSSKAKHLRQDRSQSRTKPITRDEARQISGNVSVRTALNGNIVVVVDQAGTENSRVPDGVPDMVFRYAPVERLPESINTDLDNVRVTYSSRQLQVITSDGRRLIYLSLGGTVSEERPTRASQSEADDRNRANTSLLINLSRGYGLRREIPEQRLFDGSIPPVDFEIDFIIHKGQVGLEDAPNCDGGGPGSNSCSVSGCADANPPNCSTSCDPGFYACCWCGTKEAQCKCRANLPH